MPIILKNISKAYDGKCVLSDLSLEIPDSGVFGVFGPSGCGKTTLLRIICGLERPDSGEVICDKKFSVIFQEDRLMPTLTVLENVSAVSDNETAKAWLDKVGLSDSLNKYPSELSGGMSRRTAIARALAFNADALIADEPFKGLEAELRERISQLVSECAQKRTVILVTHDEQEMALAEKNMILSKC